MPSLSSVTLNMYSNGAGAYKSWPTTNVSPSPTGQAITSSKGTPTVSTNNVTDGASYTFTGTGFGTNNANITSWLGGTGGVIESATLGANPITGVTHWTEALNPHQIDNTRAWSYTKSILMPGTNGLGGMSYDAGGSIGRIFAKVKYYWDVANLTQMQWKMLRLCYIAGVSDADVPNIAVFNWYNGSGVSIGNSYAGGGSSGALAQGQQGGDGTTVLPTGSWYDVEYYFIPNTIGSADGSMTIRTRRMSDGVVTGNWVRTGCQFYGPSETNHFRYMIFQDYLGNETPSGAPYPENLWLDDVYVQSSTSNAAIPYVVATDSATYSSSTIEEIQPWTAWSDTSITININKGGMSNLSGKYLYVMNSPGNPQSTTGKALV